MRVKAAVVIYAAAWQIGVGCLGRVLRLLTKWAQDGDQTERDEEQERRDLTERVVEHPARFGDFVADSAAGAANVCHRGD